MSMTQTLTASPLDPPTCASWCEQHGDHGLYDAECASASELILPKSTAVLRTYVHAQLVEHHTRRADEWTTEEPAVLLRVDEPAGIDLTLAEAKHLAETLNDLVALAELGAMSR